MCTKSCTRSEAAKELPKIVDDLGFVRFCKGGFKCRVGVSLGGYMRILWQGQFRELGGETSRVPWRFVWNISQPFVFFGCLVVSDRKDAENSILKKQLEELEGYKREQVLRICSDIALPAFAMFFFDAETWKHRLPRFEKHKLYPFGSLILLYLSPRKT